MINILTFYINHSRYFLAPIEVFCLACVTPSIFYLCDSYSQRVLDSFTKNFSIKFPQVSRFWESISLALECYVMANSHDCRVWSQNDLLWSICNANKIFTLAAGDNWCLADNLLGYSKKQSFTLKALCRASMHGSDTKRNCHENYFETPSASESAVQLNMNILYRHPRHTGRTRCSNRTNTFWMWKKNYSGEKYLILINGIQYNI